MDTRLFRFLLVGATGLAVNSGLLAAFTELFGVHYLLSAALATQGSTLWNYILTDQWVFDPKGSARPRSHRLFRFYLLNNLALALRGPLLALLTSGLGIHYLVSNLGSIAGLALLRFLIADRWIWTRKAEGTPPKPTIGRKKKVGPSPRVAPQNPLYCYDIHAIIRVVSPVALPELGYFRTPRMKRPPDLRIRIGSHARVDFSPTSAVVYDEGLGDLGFWVKITRGAEIEVIASPLLARSPHVLYTNVVEPLLRWTFVRKGFALLHGACLAHDELAVLVTARTDTGKTSTILRALTRFPFAYLSDDMILLGPDGMLRAYPKPLTISLHTLTGLDQARLTRRERLALQVQSRLHSRSGRLMGRWLSQAGLPAASLNAVVQMVIPPPKFPVHRLMPGVRCVSAARLSHLVLLERGADLEELLEPDEVLDTILENLEDAFGFPPYPALEDRLCCWNGEDLHHREREIIQEAVAGLPAVRLRSPNFGWWRRLPAVYYGQPFGEVKEPISGRYPTIPRKEPHWLI